MYGTPVMSSPPRKMVPKMEPCRQNSLIVLAKFSGRYCPASSASW